jgi:hypothetical protein
MIHNLVVDHYRRQPPVQTLNDNAPDFGNIEDTTDQNIRKLRVRDAIHELTPGQQQVIALKFLEGWENEQIAHTLKKPVGAVKSLQHRALTNLQKILLDDKVDLLKDDEYGAQVVTLLDELRPVPARNPQIAARARARFLAEAVSIRDERRLSIWTIFQQK